MSGSDPVTHNQIHHIHNLTQLVTISDKHMFWVAAVSHMIWQFNDNLLVMYKPLAKLSYLYRILQLCRTESFWGWSTMTLSDWSKYQADCGAKNVMISRMKNLYGYKHLLTNHFLLVLGCLYLTSQPESQLDEVYRVYVWCAVQVGLTLIKTVNRVLDSPLQTLQVAQRRTQASTRYHS